MEMLAMFGAAGGTAAAGTAAAATGMQVAGTVFSAITGFISANSKKNALKVQAEEVEMQITDDYIAGSEQQKKLYQEMGMTIGDQAVNFAAGGVSLNSASAKSHRNRAISEAESAVDASKTNTTRKALVRKRQARNIRSAAKNVMTQQIFKTIGMGFDLGTDIAKRGVSSQAGV